MVFRYSGEPGGWLTESLSAKGPVDWRPPELDWAGWPLVIAASLTARYEYCRRGRSNPTYAEPGHSVTLLCLSAFALSDGSVPAIIATLISIWLCSIISLRREQSVATGRPVYMTAALLLFACLLSAYMHVQHGCSATEFILILMSAAFGAVSAGVPPSSSHTNRLAMPLWFTLLLVLTWLRQTTQPGMRLLVMLELSAAFIAARHFLLTKHYTDTQDIAPTDTAEPQPDTD